MVRSTASSKLEEFGARLNDSVAAAAIEAALRHEERPGPVVSLIGAAMRGKSTLFGRLAGRAPAGHGPAGGETPVSLAYGSAWSDRAYRLFPSGVRHTWIPEGIAGNALLIDTPALNTEAGRAVVAGIVALSDMVLMAVQVTQPDGFDEVAFAREHLAGIPAVLVITKADLADEEDFADGVEAVMRAYSAVPWRAVVVSGRSGSGETAEGRQGLPGLMEWWKADGAGCAISARRQRATDLRRAWFVAARTSIQRAEAAAAEELARLDSESQVDESLGEACSVRERLRQELAAVEPRAVGLYQERLSGLPAELSICLDDCFCRQASGLPDPQKVEQAVRTHLETWDERTCAAILVQMKPALASLEERQREFTRLVNRLGGAVTGSPPAPWSPRGPTAVETREAASTLTYPIGLDLPAANQESSWMTPFASAAGVLAVLKTLGIRLSGPFAPLVLLVPVVANWRASSDSAPKQSKLRADMQHALEQRLPEAKAQLVERCRLGWLGLCDEIAARLAPYERHLWLGRAARVPDSTPGQRARMDELARQRDQCAALRRELAALTAGDLPMGEAGND